MNGIDFPRASNWMLRTFCLTIVTVCGMCLVLCRQVVADDSFEQSVKPFLAKNCIRCHQIARSEKDKKTEPKGGVDLGLLNSEQALMQNPELLEQIIDVLDSRDMPPETEPPVSPAERVKVLKHLKQALVLSTEKSRRKLSRVRRLNRFQYNYTVRDLFQLNRDVFSLPEKLMTRHTAYLGQESSRMPDQVRVASYALTPKPGLRAVKAFPKDLRAAHGFDNQSNQLTMSPLLLDAFLRLAVSIVESPDFNEQTVGIWNEFFKEPNDQSNLDQQIKSRLRRFLNRAFRGKADEASIERYTQFAVAKIKTGTSFTESMKKVVSAALSSPYFLYRIETGAEENRQLELASRLSYLLWSSAPDEKLLELAAQGKLLEPKTLDATVSRMFSDPKIERFLDTFPAQWLQLENVLAATPDPAKQRFFSLDKNHPASLQMLIEPLLLMDTVFVENRPITDLIQPEFGYQSEFLKTWYGSDLKPPRVDVDKIMKQNRANDQRRQQIAEKIKQDEARLSQLVEPIRNRLLAAKKKNDEQTPIDLKPLVAWDFEGNLKPSVGTLELKPHGKVEFKDGKVLLRNSYLLSHSIPVDLKDKTLEVWCEVPNLDMRGGGVMGIQGQGDFFDTIVIGERKPRHWISGSNGFSRTLDFPESKPEDAPGQLIHLVMVYRADGTTLLYRNGQPYGKPFNKGRAVFPKNKSQVIFGLRHLPPGGNKFLHVNIDRAVLYDRALTSVEVLAANSGKNLFVTEQELLKAMSGEQKRQKKLLEVSLAQSLRLLKNVPANQNPGKVVLDSNNRYDNAIRSQLRDQTFRRIKMEDPRYGGVITNAAIMSMTSGPKRSHPIARGAWIIEVIFNDPPPPPPNDVPPLNEESGDQNLTIREKFKVHRENPDCAGCHSRLDPLGFAMENFDLTGRWRDKYENGRDVDMKGRLLRRHSFDDIIEFKKALLLEKDRVATAFTRHLMRFALGRELNPKDRFAIERINANTRKKDYTFRSILRQVILSDLFLGVN